MTALSILFCESDQYLLLNFYENGKFMMKVTLGGSEPCMASTRRRPRYMLAIDRDFSGFAGANITEVALSASPETLR